MVLTDGENILHKEGWYLGSLTNNQAEYTALIHGMEHIIERTKDDHGSTGNHSLELVCISDSELMIRQMNGQYKVRNPAIKTLFQRVHSLADRLLAGKFSLVLFVHAPRDHIMISKADAILNDVLDMEMQKKGGEREEGVRK